MRNWPKPRNALALAVLVIAASAPAAAQTVFCANCSEEYTQWLNYLQLARQLEKQAALLQNAVKNTTALPNFTAGTGLSDLRAVTAILAKAQSLSFASADIDAQFAKKFKDYNGYAASRLDNQTMAAKYQQWSSDAVASAKSAFKAAGLQASQMEGAEEQTLKALEGQAAGVEGSLEAQQTALALSIETVRQLQKLRQLVMLNMQLAANYAQNDQDRSASERAAWRQFTTSPKISTTNGMTFRAGE